MLTDAAYVIYINSRPATQERQQLHHKCKLLQGLLVGEVATAAVNDVFDEV